MEKLTLDRVEQILFHGKKLVLQKNVLDKTKDSFEFLQNFSKDKIIYGINTGFGPMAQFRIDSNHLEQLQYNLIRSHASGSGEVLTPLYAKSVVLARLQSLALGKSGISPEVVTKLLCFLNNGIVPEIHEHGGVGASGDLVQLSHLALNLIGEGHVYYQGNRVECSVILEKLAIEPLSLKLRDGLGIINGTSCMTGIAAINLIYAERLLNLAITSSAILNEIILSFSDSFSEELNSAKLHNGQRHIAQEMRNFLSDSKLIQNREDLFNDNDDLEQKQFKKRIQEYYSLRCVPQILGPVYDTINNSKHIIENELNSTSDNPVIDTNMESVYHGGNFHGDYVSFEMDKLKIAITKVSMLLERQLNFMLNDSLNKKFPVFLNAGKIGFNFGFQGIQYTATSTTAENQTLCTPMYIHSIPSNNDNQDIVSMGTNSALITKRVIDNTFQVAAINISAICQAIDLMSDRERSKLSTKTVKFHEQIRAHIPFIEKDETQAENLKSVCNLIKEKSMI